MTAFQRTPAVPFNHVPGELPQASVPEDVDLAKIQRFAIERLNTWYLEDLTTGSLWRDFLSFTGTYRTFHSSNTVHSTLNNLGKRRDCSSFKPGDRSPRVSNLGCVDIDLRFVVQHGRLLGNGAGTVSMVLDPDGQWRIWMLRTWLEKFEGHGDPDNIEVPDANGMNHQQDSPVYDAVIVGGGQAGLSAAGRMQALGIRYLMLEKNEFIGDVWRNRYDSLKWHTTKEYGNLPFGRTYSPEDGKMLPAERIGAGHQDWAEKYNINARTGANVEHASYSESSSSWSIEFATKSDRQTISSRNMILCIGPGHATPISPSWASEESVRASSFQGTIMHSTSYKSAHPFAGKKGVVIGTANTAHDVAEDMANEAMHTTMVQRGRTFVMPVEWLHAAQDVNYNTEISTAEADRETFTFPNKITRDLTNRAVFAGVEANAGRFDALERAGFKVDRFGDIYMYLYVRFGGHYVDIGASDRIASGEIEVCGKAVRRLSEKGLVFQDGSELEADLIVLCTGFDHDFRADAARIVGKEAAEQMDDYWAMDAEGEIRGLAKKAGHPHLYYHGGDIRIARWFSRFIALQVQAEKLGSELEVYLD